MKLKLLALMVMICIGAATSVAQTKKKATGSEPRAESKRKQDVKHPTAIQPEAGSPSGHETATPGTGNGLAPDEHTKVKGTGEGSGPGSDAGVGLNSGIGSSTSSSSGSGAIPVNEGLSDGTNTKPRATPNMAGSPLPSNSNVIERKKSDEAKVANKKTTPPTRKGDEPKPDKRKNKPRG